jgi:hypothetical protein
MGSSAGWKTNGTRPAMRSRWRASSSATPATIAQWASCPQAWWRFASAEAYARPVAGPSDMLVDDQPEGAHARGQRSRGAHFLEGQLGIPVQLPVQRDHSRGQIVEVATEIDGGPDEPPPHAASRGEA